MTPSTGVQGALSKPLSPRELKGLIELRHTLHLNGEISGQESATSRVVKQFLAHHPPDELIENLGGAGLAAIYEGSRPGPTLLFRADMDALPIPETIELGNEPVHKAVSHRCGHDGHMAILCGLATLLCAHSPGSGRVVLLFQPAEETGEGAQRVLGDPGFQGITPPDYVFALHNLPQFPRGQVVVREHSFASASRGLWVGLRGTTSHAAEPAKGISPALAVAQMVQTLSSVSQFHTSLDDVAQITVVHACVGEDGAYGTSPGHGVVQATLRSHKDEVMNKLIDHCQILAKQISDTYDLESTIRWTQEFPSTENHPEAVRYVERAAGAQGLDICRPVSPFPWSEDFGHFTRQFKGCLFGLGAGSAHPNLHNPSYDFPDDIIGIGVALFHEICLLAQGNRKHV